MNHRPGCLINKPSVREDLHRATPFQYRDYATGVARVPSDWGSSMSETFSARANAVFGVLDEPTKAGGWQLDPAQGFNPGAADALEQDSSEDGEEVPEAGSLPGADDSEEEQSYKQKASKCYRRAFEREEEEDEFDRVAAGSISQEQRPARSTEVCSSLGAIFGRPHCFWKEHCFSDGQNILLQTT